MQFAPPPCPVPVVAFLASMALAIPASAQDGAAPGRHIHTDREGFQLLQLPKGEDAFTFAVFGDRTGGPPSGVEILRQAVADTNLLDPDLVMTVGDMVQGYNTKAEWLAEVEEYKGVMADLEMAWFPVAGNHDIYYRGPDRPLFHHEDNFEKHFGPLWYAFEHQQCLFVVLYSDEGDRITGEKAFQEAELQRMSPEQFGWLDQILSGHGDKRHVFVFLHHPRWIGGDYGDDWERVHRRLAAAGNVSAVFAGHIHRMRYDGIRDGIEYFTLATTGGHLSAEIPQAGYLHHFHVVTVRDEQVSLAALPVGAVLDPRQITGDISDAIATLNRELAPQCEPLRLNEFARADHAVRIELANPTERPIEVTLTPEPVAGFHFQPDHVHLTVAGGDTSTVELRVARAIGDWDDFAVPQVTVACDYLAEGLRISLPERPWALPLAPPLELAAKRAGPTNGVLRLAGAGCAEVQSAGSSIPDGPFTIEAWIRGDDFSGRTGLATKTENAEYGLFVSDGRLSALAHLDGNYVTARSEPGALQIDRWHHVAGVFDGERMLAFIDGKLVGDAEGSGTRTRNDLPLMVGADVNPRGGPTSQFRGHIDEFRLSTVARYGPDGFDPPLVLKDDGDTAVWLSFDRRFGPWFADRSGSGNHALARNGATLEVVERQ